MINYQDFNDFMVERLAEDPELLDIHLRESFRRYEKEQDLSLLLKTLKNIAKARSIADVANSVGLTKPGVYKALSEKGNPRISNFQAILKFLGYKMVIKPIKSEDDKKQK